MKKFVFRAKSEDNQQAVIGNLIHHLRQSVHQTGKDYEIRVLEHRRHKTSSQNATLFMWHTEVASQLTVTCSQMGSPIVWTREDVHELVFKARCMPLKKKSLPNGDIVEASMGTSDPDCDTKIMSQAMEQYLAWIYQNGMEVTIPDDQETQKISRGAYKRATRGKS